MGFVQARVSDLVNRPPVTVLPTTTVEDAVKLMYKEGVGSVVVTSPEGRVVGIFTERDLVRIIGMGLPLTTKIGDVMTKNPLVVREDEHLSRAVSLMAEHRIRHLPIVDAEGRVKGVISARDITSKFKKYMEELGEIGE